MNGNFIINFDLPPIIETWYNKNIPETLSDAILALYVKLSDEDKQQLIENGAISVHHSLGRWIRNNWGLWEDSILKKNLENEGFTHPDDMSNYIIEEFLSFLKFLKEKNDAERNIHHENNRWNRYSTYSNYRYLC